MQVDRGSDKQVAQGQYVVISDTHCPALHEIEIWNLELLLIMTQIYALNQYDTWNNMKINQSPLQSMTPYPFPQA